MGWDGIVAHAFVSFSQNLEDVVLSRALSSVAPGFYIDLGAGDPIQDSVTWAFYQAGWREINVEPAPETFRRLCLIRPEDINLGTLVGASAGHASLFLIDGESGFSTMEADIAEVTAAPAIAAGKSASPSPPWPTSASGMSEDPCTS